MFDFLEVCEALDVSIFLSDLFSSSCLVYYFCFDTVSALFFYLFEEVADLKKLSGSINFQADGLLLFSLSYYP